MDKSLREDLRRAITQRLAAMRHGRSRRRDHDRVRAAICMAERFLNSYPQATDERVRQWCTEHREQVAIIVPDTNPRQLARLLFSELRATQNDTTQDYTTQHPAT